MTKEAAAVRLRIITVKNDKVLLTYDSEGDFFFYVGGNLNMAKQSNKGHKEK